jgi:hypothetical protein
MKKSEKQILAVVCLIGFFVAWFGGFLTQFGLPPPAFQFGGGQPSTYTPTDQDKENYKNGIGRWNVFCTVSNSLDPASTLTITTDYKIYWYSRQGVEWIYHETGNDKYVSLTPADGGCLWVVLVPVDSTTDYYVDYQKICTTNQWIGAGNYLYTDVDGDGVKDFAFRYDMKGHAIPNSGYPSITFLGFMIAYDASFTGLCNLSNDTGIGQTTNTVFYDYYLSFGTTKSGVAIWKVEVKIGTTDETKVRLKKLNVPGLGYLDASLFDKQYTSSDYRYVYTISTSFDGALYLKYPANSQNRFDMTLSLEYTLADGDDILITLTVYYLKAITEAGTSTSDTFYAQE